MARPSRLSSSGTGGARRGRMLGALVSLVALVAVTACGSGNPGAQWQQPGAGGLGAPAVPSAQLTYSHQKDATGVSPGQPVSVQVIDGTLDAVTLTDASGTPVKGELANENALWRSTQDLEYDKTYTLTVKSTGEDGKTVEDARSFSTVKPGNYSAVFLRANTWMVLDGGTFGVGQPIVAHYDEPIPDKAAAERALIVTTTPAVEGSWYWVSDRELHWRPQNYWVPGTKVSVQAKLLGASLGTDSRGRTLYGQENNSASFTIGPSRVARVDNNTHQMTVFIDGTHVRTIPVSLGMNGAKDKDGNWVDFRTTSGPHVVTEKADPVRMRPNLDKTDPLYYDELIQKAVRISNEGIYVHSAPWSEWAQGSSNQSHGCVNISAANAVWFYGTFNAGDVVEIANTGRQLQLTDGLGDWTLSWEQWKQGSALNAG